MGQLGTTKTARARTEGFARVVCAAFCTVTVVLAPGLGCACGQTQLPANVKPDNAAPSGQPASDYIHGTIDVVVSTRDGFVLATDSRATYSDGTHSDDAQKLFTVGSRAACVVAGTVGTEIGLDGFSLRDAIGSHLLLIDRLARESGPPPNASIVAGMAGHAFESVIGLVTPNAHIVPGVAGEVSAVSMTEKGEADWMSSRLPIATRFVRGEIYFTVGTPVLFLHSSSMLGLRFDVEAIGQPAIALELLHANELGEDTFSRSQIMRKFYRLKKRGRLDDFRLRDGIALARLLEEATIAQAPASAGVGGPIDIMTLTEAGQKWIQRKERSAPFPPPYRMRLISNSLTDGWQALDGLQCLACFFKNVKFTFNGDGDVELVQAKFEGTCQLTLGPRAREKMPHTVQLLENLLRGKCEIIGDQGH